MGSFPGSPLHPSRRVGSGRWCPFHPSRTAPSPTIWQARLPSAKVSHRSRIWLMLEQQRKNMARMRKKRRIGEFKLKRSKMKVRPYTAAADAHSRMQTLKETHDRLKAESSSKLQGCLLGRRLYQLVEGRGTDCGH